MNKKYKIFTVMISGILLSLLFFYLPKAKAQWAEQQITLKPGWNSVFLEVYPQPNKCDEVFKEIPIASVWTWNPQISTVEYIQDPDNLVPRQPGWMVYLPPSNEERFLTNLYMLMGERAYLIKLDGEDIVNLTVVGRPCTPRITWKQNSFNLVGFHLNPGHEPMFESFFSASPAQANQDIYRLNENDIWEKVAFPAATAMKSGEAYWVYCKGKSDYTGPLVCRSEGIEGLDFEKIITEQPLLIQNLTGNEATVSLNTLSSKDPIDTSQPEVAGDVPLSYWKVAMDLVDTGWEPLPATLSVTAAAKQEKSLRLAVRRAAMPPTGTCQSILELSNDVLGMRVLVPVSAIGSGGRTDKTIFRGKVRYRDEAAIRHAGLWVGSVVINKVNQPADPQRQDPVDTGSAFQFRLIIHVDAQGNAKLLKEIIQMWAEGTLKPDPNDPNIQVVDQPGYYVLLADESLISNYSGAALRGGKPVGRRISSAAFSFPNPLALTGSFSQTGTLSCTISVGADDPLNPYKHKYHPDHDNLDPVFNEYREEAYPFKRQITLEFTDHDPTPPGNRKVPGWGDTHMGGIYKEIIPAVLNTEKTKLISGVYKYEIKAEGYFLLRRVSTVDVLDGIIP